METTAGLEYEQRGDGPEVRGADSRPWFGENVDLWPACFPTRVS